MFYLIQLVIIYCSASTHEFLKFYRELEYTGAHLHFLSQLLHRTSKFTSWVVPPAFKSFKTNWHNDEKDWLTWTWNQFERRFRCRRVEDFKFAINNSWIQPRTPRSL